MEKCDIIYLPKGKKGVNKMVAICYKENGLEYLAYYTYKSLEDATATANEINSTKPARLWNGEPALAENREYFAVEQPEMY